MDKNQIMESLARAIVDGDPDLGRTSAQEALASGVGPLEAVEQGLAKGMASIGEMFEQGEAYLPELLMATNTFNAAMEILKPEIEARKEQVAKTATVLIGTVQGDVHNPWDFPGAISARISSLLCWRRAGLAWLISA